MSVLAEVSWIRPEEGGRNSPPPGPRYITVAKLEALADRWPDEAWSLVVEWRGTSEDVWRIKGHVRFLVDEAPDHLLVPGSRFELFEGRRLVARGCVLEGGA